jgi:hypothetical protein
VKAYRAPTMTALHDLLCDKLIFGTEDQVDVVSSVDVQIHDVVAEAKSMEWDFDLKRFWLTPSRWTMMLNQYIDGQDAAAWLEQCVGRIGTKGRGIGVLRTNVVRARGGAISGHSNQTTRRWGSCMLAVSYKAKPRPQITLLSRTSYLGYLGGMDMSVAQVLGRYLAGGIGIPVEDMAFVWHNQAIQWHNFKSLAYLLTHPDDEKRTQFKRYMMKGRTKLSQEELHILDGSPALTLTRKWIEKLRKEDRDGVTYGDMTYNTYRRIRRRYHTEVLGYDRALEFEGWSYYKSGPKEGEQREWFGAYKPLPSTHVSTLGLSKLGITPDGSWSAVEFKPGSDAEDDDE